MGRAPCCDKMGVKRGAWTSQEDRILLDFIHGHGHGNWRALPKQAGLLRCGKSCRLRWTNYLRPDIKRGNLSPEEEEAIINLHKLLGNRWSAIASRLPGRTDNEIKNVWNTYLKKRILQMGIDPVTHAAATHSTSSASPILVSLHNSGYSDASLIASPSMDKDTLEATVTLPFPIPPNGSSDSPTTSVFSLSDSFYDSADLSSEIFSSMSTIDSDTVSADSGSLNSFEVDIGYDQQLQNIEDESTHQNLLLDDTFFSEYRNIEDEESWLPGQRRDATEMWGEQSSSLKAHYFVSAYPKYDFLSSMDVVEGTNLHIPDFQDNDDDIDYWLNVLREA